MNCSLNVELLPEPQEIVNKRGDICPVDWSLKIADTARMNHCGKSVMCRDGMIQLYTIICDIVSDKGQPEDLELLKDICIVIRQSDGCDLASKAAELIFESLERYADEWDIHIRRKRCTALACKRYYTVHVLPEKCTGEGACLQACRYGAILGGTGLISVINNEKCTRCGACLEVCPSGAIRKAGAVKPKVPEAPVPVGSLPSGDAEGGTRRRKRKSAE